MNVTAGAGGRSVNVVISRRFITPFLIAASLTACGAEEREQRSEPHKPASADERLLASRYRTFAEALERRDADGVCRALEPRLAVSYGCDKGTARIPQELREIAVSDDEILAAADPATPDEIQISAPTTRGGGGASLIVFFRRDGDRGWRIARAILGGYG